MHTRHQFGGCKWLYKIIVCTAFQTLIPELASVYDPHFEGWREMEREVADSLLELAQRYMESGLPSMCGQILRHVERLDPASTRALLEEGAEDVLEEYRRWGRG